MYTNLAHVRANLARNLFQVSNGAGHEASAFSPFYIHILINLLS